MARIFACGFELRSNSNGVEMGTVTGTQSINTSIFNGGSASWRVNPSSGTAKSEWFIFQNVSSYRLYIKFALRIATAPSAQTKICEGDGVNIYLNTDRTLTLKVAVDGSVIGTTASPLSLDTWYTLELYRNSTQNDEGFLTKLRVDEVEVISGGFYTGETSTPYDNFALGAMDSCTTDLYFDDVVVDTAQYPGISKLAYLRPNANGDSGTGFASVDEITPNDGTDYVTMVNNGDTFDFNVESPSSYGIVSEDTIKAVYVGTRCAGAASGGYTFTVRNKSASGGTTAETGSIGNTGTAYVTYIGVGYYNMIRETDPTTGNPWLVSGTNSLENMQIGVRATDAAPDIRITAMWAIVEYKTFIPTFVPKIIMVQ